MSNNQGREGNGAVVAIVLVLGIICLLGVVLVVGGAALFFVRAAPGNFTVTMPPATKVATTPAVPSTVEPSDPSAAILQIEVDGGDQILVAGKIQTLNELKQTFQEIKIGNSPFTEIKIKFANSSDAKTQEVFAVLKDASILYEVDPTGKVPAEAANP